MPAISISPEEVAIGAIPVADGAMDMPDMAIPVLVGAIDIFISIDMIACTCMESSEKRVQSYIAATAIKARPTRDFFETAE